MKRALHSAVRQGCPRDRTSVTHNVPLVVAGEETEDLGNNLQRAMFQ
jgi:hypothetical protein